MSYANLFENQKKMRLQQKRDIKNFADSGCNNNYIFLLTCFTSFVCTSAVVSFYFAVGAI